ncbi:MAG: polyprenyl synthetase family protein [Bacteroidales bacterium]|nr:polyprenyl synthetase family protein [Bacteroidales bacterium]
MSSIDIIKAPVVKEVEEFEKLFGSLMKSKIPLLNIVTKYILKKKGKQLRPIVVFLSAKLLGEINQSVFHAASLIELMHTATLIHDDVVDDSFERRSFFSINALWKNKVAVLIGDFLLSRGLLLAVNNNEYDLLKIVSVAVREMSEGELLQIEKSRKLDITEEVYFKIIRKKTASLIASCSEIGAKSVGADEQTVEKMRLFGENMGIAFQIKDDLFDYQNSKFVGKPFGNDIKEKKITLPLIFALRNATSKEKQKIKRMLKKNNKRQKTIKEIVNFVIDKKGVEYAVEVMNDYKNKALEIIDTFPENEAKKSLAELVEYITKREK